MWLTQKSARCLRSEDTAAAAESEAPHSLQSHCVCVALRFVFTSVTGIIITMLCVICSLMFLYAGVKSGVCHYGE